MAKKAASKKTTASAIPELAEIILSFRKASEDLERLGPIMDLKKVLPGASALKRQLETWLGEVQGSLLLPEDEFARIQPAWAEVWLLAKKPLLALAAKDIGETSAKLKKPERDADHRSRVLLELLQKGGDERVHKALDEARKLWKQEQEAVPAKASHVSDKEANEYLKTWGRLSEAEFLALYPSQSADLLKRAGAMLGVKISKPTTANMKSLHKMAHRFAINTAS